MIVCWLMWRWCWKFCWVFVVGCRDCCRGSECCGCWCVWWVCLFVWLLCLSSWCWWFEFCDEFVLGCLCWSDIVGGEGFGLRCCLVVWFLVCWSVCVLDFCCCFICWWSFWCCRILRCSWWMFSGFIFCDFLFGSLCWSCFGLFWFVCVGW